MDEYEPPRQRKKPKVKESIIDHTYRDYSQVEVSSDDEAISATSDERKHTRLQPNFPAKLHAIVSNPKYQHIICWQVSVDFIYAFSSLVLFHHLTGCSVGFAANLATREELEDSGEYFLFILC
jgi:hypothetical protein